MDNDSRQVMYRDFIYLDTDRVQSILAQLNEGVLSQVMEGKAKEATAKVGATAGLLAQFLPFLGALEVSGAYKSNVQSSKVLHDYAFNLVLKSLRERNLLLEGSALEEEEVVTPSSAFVLAQGHASLRDFSLLQDLPLFEEAIQSSQSFNQSGSLQDNGQPQPSRPKRRAREAAARKASNGRDQNPPQPQAPEPSQFRKFAQLAKTLVGDSLHFTLVVSDDMVFVGPLLRQFLREQIQHIIFKYGGSAQEEWWMLAQVTHLPESGSKMADLSQMMRSWRVDMTNMSTIADAFGAILDVVSTLQEAVASVSYPAVAVTPIAIYREMTSLAYLENASYDGG